MACFQRSGKRVKSYLENGHSFSVYFCFDLEEFAEILKQYFSHALVHF